MNTRILPRSVLVIEDEPSVRELIAVNLEHRDFHVYQASDAETAKQSMPESRPDLILVDWMLPGQSGLSLVQELRRTHDHAHTPIIMITARADEHDVIAALEAGVDDYVTKPFSPGVLMARVMAVLRRRAPELSDGTIRLQALTLSPSRHEVTCSIDGTDVRVEMGPTEFRLLHFLMTRPELVHTRLQIRDKLWNDHNAIDERTIDAHIKRLRSALARVAMDGMIQTVRQVGYRLTVKASSLASSAQTETEPQMGAVSPVTADTMH